jgi:uncharacterized membrane protein
MKTTVLLLLLLSMPARATDEAAQAQNLSASRFAARLAHLLIGGVSAGAAVGTQLSASPHLAGLDGPGWIAAMGGIARPAAVQESLLFGGIVLSTSTLQFPDVAAGRYSEAFHLLTAAGFVLQLAAFLIAVFGNMPINDQVLAADPSAPPENWRELRTRWESFHTARTICSVAGFTLAISAALLDRPAR